MSGASSASATGDDWEDVVSYPAPVAPSLHDFLQAAGLSPAMGEQIAETTGAGSVSDLALLDAAMVESVIGSCGLKMVHAEKLRRAVAGARIDVAEPAVVKQPGKEPALAKQPSLKPAGEAASSSAAPAARPPVAPTLSECVVVCIDRSGSMGTPLNEVSAASLSHVPGNVQGGIQQRTRMEAVKAMFYAFRDATELFGRGSHHLGLIQFDNKVETLLGLTGTLDRFESIVDDIERRGQTAIFSSIVQAAAMLEPVFGESPGTDLRILALTDGQNNTGASADEALGAAQRVGAVIDA
jgi:Mg-chelatase subunit ChlD